jgi:hypothetical protein
MMRPWLVIALVGCGGASAPPREPAPPPRLADAPPAPPPRAAPLAVSGGPLTAAECGGLADHVLSVVLAERAPTTTLPDADLAQLRTATRAEFTASCAQLPRTALACILGAQTTTAIEACEPAPQPAVGGDPGT